MSHIFISYARTDIDFARKIVVALAEKKLDTWIDWQSIPKGEDWEQQIYRGVEEADAFLFLISPDSVASQMCNKEIAHAVRNGKRILPIFIANVDEREIHLVLARFSYREQKEEIARRNFIFCRDSRDDFNSAIEEIHNTIRTDFEWLKYHTNLQVKALDWERRQENSGLLRRNILREAEEQLAAAGQKDPPPTDLQKQYILESRRVENRSRNSLLTAASVVIIILSFLSVYAFNQSNLATNNAATAQANLIIAQTAQVDAQNKQVLADNNASTAVANEQEAKRQAQIALSRQLAAQAVAIFGQDYGTIPTAQEYYGAVSYEQKTIAVLLAVQSMKIFPSAEAARVLQNNDLLYPKVQLLHGAKVDTVAFSPDGRYIVSGSGSQGGLAGDVADNAARVWDIMTGQEISHFNHDGGVSFVAFSLDGRRVFSASKQTIFVWDAFTGDEIMHMTQNNQIDEITISNNYIVSAGGQTVHIWDAITGHEITSFQHAASVYSVDISPSNGFIASGDGSGTIQLWDSDSESVIRFLQHGQSIVNSLDFSPDGKYLVSGGQDADARVWEIATGDEISRVEYFNPVRAVAFSPDGKYVISSSDDGITNVSEVLSGKIIHSLTRNIQSSGVAEFSPDGSHFVAARADSHALFETESGLEIANFPVYDFPYHTIENISFSPDGRYVASGGCGLFELKRNCSETSVIVWDAYRRRDLAWLNFSDVNRDSYYFSVNGKYIIPNATYDNGDHIYDVFAHKNLFYIPVHLSNITVSRNGEHIAASSSRFDSNQTLHVWDVNTPTKIVDLTVNDVLFSVSFSPDSRYIAAGGSDNNVHIWELNTKREIITLHHGATIQTVSYSSNGQYIVSVGEDNIARVWEVSTGKEIAQEPHDSKIVQASFSPNSQYLLTVSYDDHGDNVHIWNIITGSEIFLSKYNSQNFGDNDVEDFLNSSAFSPDSKYLALGSSHGIINIFEITSGKEIITMRHSREVETVAFSPDGKYIVSGSLDGTARVWDVSLGKEIISMSYDGNVYSVGFSSDGSFIFSLGCSALDIEGQCQENSARIWKWRPSDLIDDSCIRLPRNLTRAEWQRYIGNVLPYQAVCPQLPIEEDATPILTVTP